MIRRTISPAELYLLEPQIRTCEIWDLWGSHYNHVPEIDAFQAGHYDISKRNEEQKRVERRVLKYVNYDGRRYWELTTVWFDGRPVMVVKNAGREGDDHYGRFITDLDAYAEMLTYLWSLIPVAEVESRDVVDVDEQRDDLLSFYGDYFAVEVPESLQ